MMSALAIFDYKGLTVRTVTIDGEVWFVGKDVCRCLDIVNHLDALSRLPDDERRDGVATTDPVRQDRLAVAINEPGVYRLIFESRKPEAEAFRRFVFHEVLPAIRRTGHYGVSDAIDADDIAVKLPLVRAARLTFGKAAARRLWFELGLPDVGEDDAASEKTAQKQALETILRDFLEACTVPDAAASVQAREIYTVYRAWALRERAPIMTETMFGLTMTAVGMQKRHARTRAYLGIRIRAESRRALEAE